MGSIIANQGNAYKFSDLDTSGNTTDYYTVENYVRHTIQYTVSDVSNNVVVRVEASVDPSCNAWFNLSAGSLDTTHTSNGTYAFTSTAHVDHIRLSFVSRNTALLGKITNIYYSGCLG